MSVPFEKELEAVAEEYFHVDEPLKEYLQRRLLPLLQAGQAMRDSGCEQCKACVAWDAERERLAQLEKR